MKSGDVLFWIWLSEALGAGNRDFRNLIAQYDSPYEIFQADEAELERLPSVQPRTVRVLANKDLRHATEVLNACERLGIGVLSYNDPNYPCLLRELTDPPALLYWGGELPDFSSRFAVGMVGTRRMSAYGLRTAYKIAYELAAVNAVIVSGMAAGIDGVCAAASIAANGQTVAVLGCGLDQVYPRHHGKLMDAIRRNGALLSEYPPGTRPESYHFPARNRIISGMTAATAVMEAGLGSGSLITARNAVSQGRDVFAVPANVGAEGAGGTNGLLRDGAKMLLDTSDILDRYAYLFAETIHPERLAEARKHSQADLLYLERLGVIELTGKQSQTQPVKAERIAAKPDPIDKKQEKSPDKPKKAVEKSAKTPKKKSEQTKTEAKILGEVQPKEKTPTPDDVIQSLTPVQLAILQAMPDDGAISADRLGGIGFSYGEIIAALTMLEILGLIRKLPGALYSKV